MKKIPNIVIVGRQNVGKSTLFNALTKKRIAIVSPISGVTRDYIEHKVEIDGKIFNIIDTGGIVQSNQNEMEYLTTLRTVNIIENATLVLFILDKSGITPIDEEIADIIRKKNKSCVVVVNKVDISVDTRKSELFSEFYSFGFKDVIPISAEHRNNFSALYEKILEYSNSNVVEEEEEIIKVAIVGKPNVGKSSILNRIANAERSIVTDIPGTTRDSIDTEIKAFGKRIVLIDTAGIRKKSKVKNDLEYYSVNRAIKSIKRADVAAVVISAVDGISSQDKKILYIINENKKAAIIIINKWDLISVDDKSPTKYEKKLKAAFPLIDYLPFIFVSAKTGVRIRNIIQLCIEVYENYHRRITTNEFNNLIERLINRNGPSQGGSIVKIHYGVQAKSAPPFFVLFTNKPDKIKKDYERFLLNKIRDNFNFKGSPIILKFRKK